MINLITKFRQAAFRKNLKNRIELERINSHLELILAAIPPKQTIFIGFLGKFACDIKDDAGFGILKQLGYKHVFKAVPKKDSYLLTKVV